jgi:hypothetical protein
LFASVTGIYGAVPQNANGIRLVKCGAMPHYGLSLFTAWGRLFEWNGAEIFYPYGRYSMAAIMRAE